MQAAFLPYATFKVHTLSDGTVTEPPSPQLLTLHATCAKIAHMSGAAKILEEMFRGPDLDGIPGVTTTGNSPAILSHMLLQLEWVMCVGWVQHNSHPYYLDKAPDTNSNLELLPSFLMMWEGGASTLDDQNYLIR